MIATRGDFKHPGAIMDILPWIRRGLKSIERVNNQTVRASITGILITGREEEMRETESSVKDNTVIEEIGLSCIVGKSIIE